MDSMSVTTEQLERSIRELPVRDMLALHEHLIVRIHEIADAKGFDSEFRTDIERRVKEIDTGKTKGVDAFRALKKM